MLSDELAWLDERQITCKIRLTDSLKSFILIFEKASDALLFESVWGGEMTHRDRSVDVFVRKVRRKLAAAAPGWTYIHTPFGIGYRFEPEAPDDEGPDGPVTPVDDLDDASEEVSSSA